MFVDTNVLIRVLTGEPADPAARATQSLTDAQELLLPDLIVAETLFVLQSYYEVPVTEVARLMRSIIAFRSIRTTDPALLLRALEVYETTGIHFAEAYLVASAETTGVGSIVSFDQGLDRIASVERVEP